MAPSEALRQSVSSPRLPIPGLRAPRQVPVSRRAVDAAKAEVKAFELLGIPVDPLVQKLSDAEPLHDLQSESKAQQDARDRVAAASHDDTMRDRYVALLARAVDHVGSEDARSRQTGVDELLLLLGAPRSQVSATTRSAARHLLNETVTSFEEAARRRE